MIILGSYLSSSLNLLILSKIVNSRYGYSAGVRNCFVYLVFYQGTISICFSVASRLRVAKQEERREHGMRRIVILIPAYKEDKVIMECVESCLCQDYPSTHYDAVVISDKMSDDTNRTLSSLPIQLEIVHFENSTKAKALNLAMSHLEGYDIALILDADNTIGPDFLRKINQAAFTDTTVAYQAHRTAKNLNTNLAYLDAVSEEINNSISGKGM